MEDHTYKNYKYMHTYIQTYNNRTINREINDLIK